MRIKMLILAALLTALTACGGKSSEEELREALVAVDKENRERREAFVPDPILSEEHSVVDYYDNDGLRDRTTTACKEYARGTGNTFLNKMPACKRASVARSYKARGQRPE